MPVIPHVHPRAVAVVDYDAISHAIRLKMMVQDGIVSVAPVRAEYIIGYRVGLTIVAQIMPVGVDHVIPSPMGNDHAAFHNAAIFVRLVVLLRAEHMYQRIVITPSDTVRRCR